MAISLCKVVLKNNKNLVNLNVFYMKGHRWGFTSELAANTKLAVNTWL